MHRFLAAAVVLSCAPAAQRAYLAPSGDTITSDTEVRQAEPPTHTIYVQNRSRCR